MSSSKQGRARRIVRISIFGILAIAALVWGGRWLAWRLGHVVTEAGFVRADTVECAPEVPGRLEEVLVREGERVAAGQVLVRLDDQELAEAVAMAEADVAHLEAKVARYGAKLKLSERQVPAKIHAAHAARDAALENEKRAQAQVGYLAKQHTRFHNLLEQQAVGRARVDEIDANLAAAHAARDACRAAVAAARARIAEAEAARAKIDEARAAREEARSGLQKAREALALRRTRLGKGTLRAPSAGVVARVFVDAGDFAAPGRPVVALYDPKSLYVEARFEETKLHHLRVGQRIAFTMDALPGQTLYGHVRLIHRASAGEFALIPRDVTAGEFTKLTQRVPVEIDFEVAPEADALVVPGMSVYVTAPRDGEDESGGDGSAEQGA